MLRRLQTVTVKGYTSIRDAQISLGALNVLVGGNGSGKSNLIGALGLLGQIVDERLQAFVAQRGGASDLLHDLRTGRIELDVESDRNGYRAVLLATRDDRLVFDHEETRYTNPLTEQVSRQSFGSGQYETSLHQRAARKNAESVESYVIDLLRGCRVFHFHDTSENALVKKQGPTADNLMLRSDASNLAAVLRVIRDASPATYRQIVGMIRLVAPFFGELVLEPETGRDTVRLRWRHIDSDRVFSAHQLSDGTLRFICLVTLLLDTDRLPNVVVLDEPELGLHPFAIKQLAEMLGTASTRSQVVVATQSVTLLDEMGLADLIVVERVRGASSFIRPDPTKLREWLDDYSVGDLWQKSLIGGRPAREIR